MATAIMEYEAATYPAEDLPEQEEGYSRMEEVSIGDCQYDEAATYPTVDLPDSLDSYFMMEGSTRKYEEATYPAVDLPDPPDLESRTEVSMEVCEDTTDPRGSEDPRDEEGDYSDSADESTNDSEIDLGLEISDESLGDILTLPGISSDSSDLSSEEDDESEDDQDNNNNNEAASGALENQSDGSQNEFLNSPEETGEQQEGNVDSGDQSEGDLVETSQGFVQSSEEDTSSQQHSPEETGEQQEGNVESGDQSETSQGFVQSSEEDSSSQQNPESRSENEKTKQDPPKEIAREDSPTPLATRTSSTSFLANPYGNDKAVTNIVTISPGQTLEFCVSSPNVQPTDVISIKSNISNKNVAFKVKTTTLGRYKVRPAIGIVKPLETTDVIITLEDKIEDPALLAKDKFLVICQEVDSDVMLSQVSELIRAVPKDLQTEHRLKVMMSKADSFSTPRKAEVSVPPPATPVTPASNKSSTNAVGGKTQLDDIQRQLERITAHNTQMESRLSTFGMIMFAQCCLLVVLTFVIVSNYWSPDLQENHNKQHVGSCKPWSLE